MLPGGDSFRARGRTEHRQRHGAIRARHQAFRRYATGGKFAERIKPRSVPGDVGRSLAVHRATLPQEPLEEIERPGCALGGEYALCKDIGTIANLLNLLK